MIQTASRSNLLAISFTLAYVLSYGQMRSVTGKVVDKETNNPIKDLEVIHGDTVVHTNFLGFFQLKANTGDTIVVTHEGYGTRMIVVPQSVKFLIALDKPIIDKVYRIEEVDHAPEPEEGFVRLYSVWAQKVEYPMSAKRMGIEGTVKIFFVVDENGSISESGIIQGLSKECDQAALSSFRSLTFKWKSGLKDGKPVKVVMVYPFTFRLN